MGPCGGELGYVGRPLRSRLDVLSRRHDDPTRDFDLPFLDFLRRTTREEFVQVADAITRR